MDKITKNSVTVGKAQLAIEGQIDQEMDHLEAYILKAELEANQNDGKATE